MRLAVLFAIVGLMSLQARVPATPSPSSDLPGLSGVNLLAEQAPTVLLAKSNSSSQGASGNHNQPVNQHNSGGSAHQGYGNQHNPKPSPSHYGPWNKPHHGKPGPPPHHPPKPEPVSPSCPCGGGHGGGNHGGNNNGGGWGAGGNGNCQHNGHFS